MPKKSQSAPAKPKPLYRRKPSKAASPKSKAHSLKPDTPTTLDLGHETLDFPNAHPISPSHFELREDGSIVSEGRAPRVPNQNPPDESGTRVTRPSENALPKLTFHDASHRLWLYHGNCLELLDAIAAKYPEGRFDAIFADPPYFLSNGGITCHAGRHISSVFN